MYKPQLADRVISALLRNDVLRTSIGIANYLQEDHEEVIKVLEYLYSVSPQDFDRFKAIHGGIGMAIKVSREGYYAALMEEGGYSKINEVEEVERIKREHDRSLDNRSKEEAIRRSKRAEWISIAAAIIALAALLVEVGRSACWWK